MTQDQEHLITLLFVKYGGFESVVDMWLHSDEKLSPLEATAIDAWLNDEQQKPRDVSVIIDEYPYLAIDIAIDPTEKD